MTIKSWLSITAGLKSQIENRRNPQMETILTIAFTVFMFRLIDGTTKAIEAAI